MTWCERCAALHETIEGVFLGGIPVFACPRMREGDGMILMQTPGHRSGVSRETEA